MMQPTPAPSSPPRSPRAGATQDAAASMPEPPQNFNSPPFSTLTGLFEKLQNERKRDIKEKHLHAWFNRWRKEMGKDLYPVLRLILPQKDRERAVYGLKEQNLAKTYIKLIPLGARDPDAIRLVNWKKPTERDKSSGDFPTVLYEVVRKRSSVVQGDLTIDDINELLDELAENMGSRDLQSKILTKVYNRATPEEQRWIARIILKDLVISVKEPTVFAVFHPDAQDLYNTCSDLKKVAWTLWDPTFRLNADEKTVRLFHAFAPMLCGRPTKKIDETVKSMGDKEFIIEEKLDGERMQLHKKGNEYFYCSRKGKNYTYLYGKHVKEGTLTPKIHELFNPKVDELILDGEMLVWDPISRRTLPFGTLKTAAGDKSKKADVPRPCFKVFDLLYLNGKSLLDRTTQFRKENMRECLTEKHGHLEFAVEFKGRTAADVRQKMDDIMETRGEGLVIKHPSAQYVLNGRNKDWIKVKPEYMDNMGETVDVIVIAGNYGTGKRQGGVSTLICAVVETGPSADEDNVKYRSFVRIGSGLSYADYLWIRSKPWKPWDPKHPPAFYKTAQKTTEDKGDLYLEPEDSFILKVKAAEIVKTDQYHMGYTMRFPRAVAIRTDLYITDCITDEGIEESLKNVSKRKMESDISTKTGKKRKIGKTKAKAMINADYQGPKSKDVLSESKIFEGLKFVVVAAPKTRTGPKDRTDMQKLVIAHGGKCQQLPGNHENLFIIFLGDTVIPFDLKGMIKKGTHDVITQDWIQDSIALGRQAPLSKRYFVFATEERQEDEAYRMEDPSEDVPMKSEEDASESTAPVVPKLETNEMADWLHVEKPVPKVEDDGSETEPEESEVEDGGGGEGGGHDSDNGDVVGDDMDDWIKLEQVDVSARLDDDEEGDEEEEMVPASDETLEDEDEEGKDEEVKAEDALKMGEDDDAMEYDTEHIFKHLCFYLDSPRNARRNGMAVKSKHEGAIDDSFTTLEKLITSNGGRIVDLGEAKMTHVVLDRRDDSRRLELIRRTAKPKRRHLVLADFIQACLDEETLLDEDEFQP